VYELYYFEVLQVVFVEDGRMLIAILIEGER